jgi:hypothetical protein
MHIKTLAKSIKKLQSRAFEDPMLYFVPTLPQSQWINDPSPIKLLLGGNQVGKTASACYLLLCHCLGRHPTLRTDPPPIEAWLITHSHEQSRTIQQKLYDLTPKHELHPTCEFVRGKGFRGMAPVVRFRNGSIIRIKTANQGLGLASATANLVVIDEPVPMDVFNECLARTIRGGKNGSRGTVAQSMTPVGNVDVSYVEEMVAEGKISVTKARLTVKDTTPIGLKPLLTEKQIKGITDSFLPIDREARINGSFHVAPIGIIFTHFSDNMISSYPPAADGNYEFSIGIDHGSRPNSQVAVLCAIDTKDPNKPIVYALDEYVAGESTPESHARAILQMLERQQIPANRCKWTGDSEHRGQNGFKMSNLTLMRAFESVLRLPHKALPFYIRTAVKRRHSVYFSASMIHSIMARGDFFVHPNCKTLIHSIKNWTMKRDQSARSRDKFGHAVDALRYAVMPIVDKRYIPPTAKIKLR